MDVPVTDTPTESHPSSAAPSWAQSMRVYLEPASVRMLFLGFSSGLPLLLVLGTLAFRLREAGIDRTTIGHMSWVGLMYGFKWVWSPLVDRMPIPLFTRWLGRRRSWLLLAQCGLVAGLVAMALVDPRQGLEALSYLTGAVNRTTTTIANGTADPIAPGDPLTSIMPPIPQIAPLSSITSKTFLGILMPA